MSRKLRRVSGGMYGKSRAIGMKPTPSLACSDTFFHAAAWNTTPIAAFTLCESLGPYAEGGLCIAGRLASLRLSLRTAGDGDGR